MTDQHPMSRRCALGMLALGTSAPLLTTCGNGRGRRFRLDGSAVINGPATSPLTPVDVAVEGGRVVRA